MKIQKNISLKEYTTFKIGGCAKYFVVIKNIEDLKQAISFSKKKKLPVFVLGGGSNLLVSDGGVDGLVLKMEIKGTDFAEQNPSSRQPTVALAEVGVKRSDLPAGQAGPGTVQVTAFAGEIWDDLVEQCVEKGLYGLENLSYIPGTVGASVVQNIGAYGVEIKDVVDWVEVFDIKTSEIKKLTGPACNFGYRDSIFKKHEGKNWVIIRVAYNLQKNGELNTDYKDIQSWIASASLRKDEDEHSSSSKKSPAFRLRERSEAIQEIDLRDIRKAIIQIRQSKLPDWKKIGTAGSFFKNPSISREQLEKILEKYPETPNFYCGNGEYKIPLAYILDKILGLKGLREGEVGLYENQPLALVNYGKATTCEIQNLAEKIQKDVKDKTGLDIDFEVVEW